MATTMKTAADFGTILRWQANGPLPTHESRFGIEVSIRDPDRVQHVRGIPTTTLDDGRILSARLVELDSATFGPGDEVEDLHEPFASYAVDHAEDPAWVADACELRRLLTEFLERLPKTQYLTVRHGGNGSGLVEVGYGEAALLVGLGRDTCG